VDLTPSQIKALIKLTSGSGDAEAAQAAGVSTRTIQNWKSQYNFRNMLRQAVLSCYDAAIAEIASGAQDAAKELKAIIADPDTPKRVKVSAITALLNAVEKANYCRLFSS
jgi:hypothetical protein